MRESAFVSSSAGSGPYDVVGEAVLLDYPLRLWDRQQEHTRELLREFTLMLAGVRSGSTHSPPQRLVDLAGSASTRASAPCSSR